MTLKEYIDNRKVLCVLSSADGSGKVTTAIYSTPHVMDDGSVCFIMREKLTWRNIRENPHAACMLIEEAAGHRGIRLFLSMIREENDPGLIASMMRRHLTPEEDRAKGPKHLVVFSVDKILPLIGDRPTDIKAG
jgi:hypothetical protein